MVVFLSSSAQDYSRKPGKITDYEMKMTTCDKDTSAAAVILCETTDITYSIAINAGSQITYQRDYYMKAKVLRQEGTDVADIVIRYYSSSSGKEVVSGISASAYNLVNGKVVETKLKKQYIFDELESGNYHRIKFSIPDVKAGSVIEVKYNIHSNIAGDIDPVVFQHEYPLVYAHAYVGIPEYYKFNVTVKGYNPINVTKNTSSGTFSADGETVRYNMEVYECTAENIPALRDEGQVWSPSDFLSAIDFELAATDFPGAMFKPVSVTWASVYQLLYDSDFTSGLKASNPFKAEVAAIVASTPGEMDRIAAIHKLVTSRIAWDEHYRLITHNIRQAVDKGSGNSADINFALNSALTAAGFKTTPILLNPRKYGRLPLTRPSIDKINAFIIRVTLADGSFVYLDGTSRYSAPNVLPTALMVDRARVYDDDSDKGWVNLTNLSPDKMTSILQATLGADGKLSGQIEKTYENVMAMNVKRAKSAAKSDEKYIEEKETEDHIGMSDYSFTDTDVWTADEKFRFSMQASTAGDFIYLNATVIPFMSKNPLTQQERKLPVEFNSPDNYVITCQIEIPEGYKVEELPKAIRMTTCDNGVSFQYLAAVTGNKINVSLKYNMSRILYSVTEYADLRTFFGMVSSLSQSNIVLKKV